MNKNDILDEQAKQDLLRLYGEVKADENKLQLFLAVLECVGCANEFLLVKEDMKDEF